MASETVKFCIFMIRCHLPPTSVFPTEDTKAETCAEKNKTQNQKGGHGTGIFCSKAEFMHFF